MRTPAGLTDYPPTRARQEALCSDRNPWPNSTTPRLPLGIRSGVLRLYGVCGATGDAQAAFISG